MIQDKTFKAAIDRKSIDKSFMGTFPLLFLGDVDTKVENMCLKYKKVIVNGPATIIIWEDGTKTVVKCSPGDKYDLEKAIALCFMKKSLGNKYNYYDTMNNILNKAYRQLHNVYKDD